MPREAVAQSRGFASQGAGELDPPMPRLEIALVLLRDGPKLDAKSATDGCCR